MKNIIEAINELIKGTNIAQSRGVYSLKEAHDVYSAIEYINNAIAAQNATQQAPAVESPVTPNPKSEGYGN